MRDHLGPDVEVGEEGVDRQVGDPGGEPLLQPQLVPPGQGDQVTEPLVGHLGGWSEQR